MYRLGKWMLRKDAEFFAEGRYRHPPAGHLVEVPEHGRRFAVVQYTPDGDALSPNNFELVQVAAWLATPQEAAGWILRNWSGPENDVCLVREAPFVQWIREVPWRVILDE